MDKVNDFKLAVTAVVALLTSLWGWFGWLVVLFDYKPAEPAPE